MIETDCPKCGHKFWIVPTTPKPATTGLPERDPAFNPATALQQARQALPEVQDAPKGHTTPTNPAQAKPAPPTNRQESTR